MSVTYDCQTVNAKNPLVRFTHRRRLALSASEAVHILPRGGTLLDYGCGPGTYLMQISRSRPDAKLIGYDPYADKEMGDFTIIDDLHLLPDNSIDLIVALETCEHLDATELREFLSETHRLLTPGGKLLISVPIVGGPGLLAKEMNRIILHRQCDYNARELAKAVLFGTPASRPVDVKSSHKGFDFRRLHQQLSSELQYVDSWLSPFPNLSWMVNSQAFSLWQRRHPAR